MKYKHILSVIVCGASLALCQGLRAQDASSSPSTTGTDSGGGGGRQGGRRGGGAMRLETLTKALDLTTDEQTQIKPILATETTTLQGLRADTTLSQQDKMAKFKDARDTANTAINAILTPDQQTKFAALQANMRNRRRGGGGGGGGGDTSASPAPSAS